jgi:hypothetical protein
MIVTAGSAIQMTNDYNKTGVEFETTTAVSARKERVSGNAALRKA